jgi:anthranilate synthase component 1
MSPGHVVRELPTWIDPEAVYLAGPAHADDSFWLDAGPGASAGWSWIGTGEPEPDDHRVRAVPCGGDDPDRPWGRFGGGWVGWAGYDAAAARAGAPAATADRGIPSSAWMRVDRFVAFDHEARRVWAVAPLAEIDVYCDAVASTIAAPALPPLGRSRRVRARHGPDEYVALIERCRAAIRDGDAYQLCLTTRFSVDGEIDPVDAYRRLRAATPAHHGGLLVTRGVALASASPERFLEVGGGVVRTRPIKGTRPRGVTPEEDAALADELVTSVKERAENVMIVDLMRNDLARVCDPATVAAEQLLEVESYAAVHQLVSTVTGRVVEGTTVGGLLDATFPAGSMTGAPKLSAMTILHALEGGPRGVFAGCFGWIGDDGALDLAMVIRSIVVDARGAYVGAGGGITWRSDAAAEVAEVGLKARGPLSALGAALPQGW